MEDVSDPPTPRPHRRRRRRRAAATTVWPPPYYPGPTETIRGELLGADDVLISNGGETTWTVRVARWVLGPCVGWIGLGHEETVRFLLPAGQSARRHVPTEAGYEATAVGVELWDHECLEPCADELTAFLHFPAGSAP